MTRNTLFGLILFGLTLVLIVNRCGLLDDDTTTDVTATEAIEEPRPEDIVSESPLAEKPDAPVEDATLSFAEYDVQYEALRDNFRARDSLIALVEGRRVVWEGTLRNVSRQTNAFYVSVRPHDEYTSTSALVTFDHAFEDQLYALSPDDRVRFEGVVRSAGLSLSITGASIETIE